MRTRENPVVKEVTEKEKRNGIIDHMDSNGLPVLRFTTDEEAEEHGLDWQRRYNSNIARWRFNQLQETKHIEIDSSVSRTVMYKDRVRTQCGAHLGGDLKSRGTPASMFFENCDAVTALFKWGRKKGRGKICIVNFADYTKAGGGYLNGVLNAQEEAVCAESDLCNILFQHHSYYSDNEKDINGSLFKDRALYSPDVIFERGDNEEVCDVLTIAAPNWKATKRSYMENVSALVSRIKYVAEIAADASVDTLIFGAFGCGVFGQDPVVVATASLCALTNCGLTNVVFAVPGSVEKEGNAKVFKTFFDKPAKKTNTAPTLTTKGAMNYGRRTIDFSESLEGLLPGDEEDEIGFEDLDCPMGTFDCGTCEKEGIPFECPLQEN